MRKALLAVAALTGFAVSANAAKLQINNEAFADVGVKLQIYGQSVEDAANGGKDRATDFTIQNARIYLVGQLNKIVKFGANFDFPVTGAGSDHEGTGTAKVRDAYVNFAFAPFLNVMAGLNRIPFSRETLTDRYDRIFMPQDGWVNNGEESVYKNQILPNLYFIKAIYVDTTTKTITGLQASSNAVHLTTDNILGGPSLGNAVSMAGITDESDYSRDAGVTIWGNINKGMISYYLGVYDSFGDHDVSNVASTGGKDNLGYVVRVQFSPTMLGFQGEGTDYYLKETYLGKKKVATIGAAYSYSKLNVNIPVVDQNGNVIGSASEDFKFKSWTVDANYEAPLGPIVPKFEAAYIYNDADDLPLTNEDGTAVVVVKKVKTWYVTLGALYNQKIVLGKIGAYLKYQNIKVETAAGDVKPKVWTLAIPYYLAGQNAKIVLQWNHYDYDKKGLDPRNANDDTNNDYTLAFQVQF